MSKAKRAKGGGRKKKFTEATKPIAFRVPISKVPEMTQIITDKLASYQSIISDQEEKAI